MRTRKKELGKANSIGAKITHLRKKNEMKQSELMAQMQARGIDIGPSSLSKLEGQTRTARGEETAVLLDIFNITMTDLYPKDED